MWVHWVFLEKLVKTAVNTHNWVCMKCIFSICDLDWQCLYGFFRELSKGQNTLLCSQSYKFSPRTVLRKLTRQLSAFSPVTEINRNLPSLELSFSHLSCVLNSLEKIFQRKTIEVLYNSYTVIGVLMKSGALSRIPSTSYACQDVSQRVWHNCFLLI